MESHRQVATVRKPAPQFEAMSYYNGFKKVKLSDYAGKSNALPPLVLAAHRILTNPKVHGL